MVQPPEFEGWLDSGWGIKVESPQQLFSMINNIAVLEQKRTYAWRGQSDATWLLESSLYREIRGKGVAVTERTVRRREKQILAEARNWGLGRDLGSSATDLHLLATLQHHGVPTRLLDVTSNPMTALWFATSPHRANCEGVVKKTSGVLFAIEVTDTPWYETFDHGYRGLGDDELVDAVDELRDPLGAAYFRALQKSRVDGDFFRAFPAIPDDRMKAQEGFFLGSSVPVHHSASGVRGFNPLGSAPGVDKLKKILELKPRGRGRPQKIPFCAIIIPESVKEQIRLPLKRTYNRRPRVLFPDVDGFRDALLSDRLD